jgi:hypothetical protein
MLKVVTFIGVLKWPLTLLLVVLKLARVIDASWLLVTSPIWACYLLVWTLQAVVSLFE